MATARDLGDIMSDSVNGGINPDELTDVIANEHRDLQNEVFTQIVKPIICEFARQAEGNNYDARNESSVKECKEIADAMGWYY